ncbi:peptide chain release factor N(5)-glutamine methyltransferase [Aliikangiella coralliicola]|uniref:Release factor glutamine methyltransferase n=1 Tax=Aliikangiella coralliicola TaxID=2592383 RepID=A0A545TW68_9GAMM|nr:peptide chain release factor N(5)-glutamine methyltransferase [Aliikangiella coralliicola]TQV81411.1 peptide chain release factor N(5)-glutamine methyltransferase [Aliikangiella coralliicola]
MNISDAIELAKNSLFSESPAVDAEYLLSKLLNKNFTWLKTWPDYQLSNQQEAEYRAMVERRKSGEPIAYITGEKAFWTLLLETNPSTLIPRPETELLVEQALSFLSQYQTAKVLDLGTGTGAIALAIASERPTDKVYACDYNQQAVELALRNAEKNQIKNATIFQSDWLNNVDESSFELIVSNPPYVAEGDPHLERGDLRFEPDGALVASGDGLDDIRRIVSNAVGYLCHGGKLMLEHGFEQGDQVRKILIDASYRDVITVQDLAGLDRVTLGSLS